MAEHAGMAPARAVAHGAGRAHHARFASDDAHDGGEALAAERAAAPVVPQRGRAVDAEPAVAALEEDGVRRSLQANDAGAAVNGCIGVRLVCARGILADCGKCRQSIMA